MEEKKGFFGNVFEAVKGVGSWIGGHLSNFGGWISTKFGDWSLSPEKGKLGILKRKLINALLKFAFDLQKTLVKQSKIDARKLVEKSEMSVKDKNSLVASKKEVDKSIKEIKNEKIKDVLKERPTTKNVVGPIMSDSKNKQVGLGKANQDLNFGDKSQKFGQLGR